MIVEIALKYASVLLQAIKRLVFQRISNFPKIMEEIRFLIVKWFASLAESLLRARRTTPIPR